MATANKFDSNAVCIAASLQHRRYNGGMCFVLFSVGEHLLGNVLIFDIFYLASGTKPESDDLQRKGLLHCYWNTNRLEVHKDAAQSERKKNWIASKHRRWLKCMCKGCVGIQWTHPETELWPTSAQLLANISLFALVFHSKINRGKKSSNWTGFLLQLEIRYFYWRQTDSHEERLFFLPNLLFDDQADKRHFWHATFGFSLLIYEMASGMAFIWSVTQKWNTFCSHLKAIIRSDL